MDSQTILGAIQHESYGYQTFYENWVGEIQSSTDLRDWYWMPGSLNIADIITRGATPADLTKESNWQLAVVHFPNTTINRLVVYKVPSRELLTCGGRIQTFSEDCKAVPLLPFYAWISTLFAGEVHSEAHDGVAGTPLRMQKMEWDIKGRIVAKKAVDKCIVCRKARERTCQQIMRNLSKERSSPAAPFQ